MYRRHLCSGLALAYALSLGTLGAEEPRMQATSIEQLYRSKATARLLEKLGARILSLRSQLESAEGDEQEKVLKKTRRVLHRIAIMSELSSIQSDELCKWQAELAQLLEKTDAAMESSVETRAQAIALLDQVAFYLQAG
ncbi:MAG: hypothetical protein KDK78_01790 [Chlamydiia bacterium]|nr:hypothetical protein [Chlamydiia bacterium]